MLKRFWLVVCLLLVALPAWATIAYQSGGSGKVGGLYQTTAQVTNLSWTSGWLVVATEAASGSTAASTNPIVDSKGNTWTQDQSYLVSGSKPVYQWWSVIATGGTGISLTVTLAGAATSYLTVQAFSSTVGFPANPVDQKASGYNGWGTTVSATASTINTDVIDLDLAVLWSGTDFNISSSSSGYTGPVNVTASQGTEAFYMVTSSQTTATFSATMVDTATLDICLTSFVDNSGPPPRRRRNALAM